MKASTLRWISLPIATILASRKGRPVRALELLSLAYTAPKELIGWLDHWQLLKEVRTDLEAQFDQNEFNRIWARGQQLDIEQVIHGLLIEFDADFRDPVEQINEGLPNPLTPKELEVLNLLAEGLTNPQIAERLFITTGTVKGHVNKILHKLEVTSRQQAASEAKTLHLLKT